MGKTRISAALCLLLGVIGTVAAQSGGAPAGHEKAGPPFRIADNLYHVGASDSAAYLIVGSAGMILLDGGFTADADAVLANVEALGFDPRRIRLLLNSQAHEDHAGALAAIKERTGARMLASRADAEQLERGGRDDFFFGDRMTFPRVAVDRLVADGERVTLGDVALTAHITPGHTKGCTTWSMKAGDRGIARDALFLCGPTVPGYRLTGRGAAYPGIAGDYEASFAAWKRLPCEVFLGAHGSYFGLERKRALMAEGRPNPFVDPKGCRAFLARTEKAFRDQLRRERAGR